MESSELVELFKDHLKDVYDAEKQLTKALPRMAKAATDPELAQGFRDHTSQTQEQVKRLEQIFQSMEMKARGKPCVGMKGLLEEGQEIMGTEKGSALDISLFAAARKVEHYEMVAYEALIAAAQAVKQTDAVSLLRETLQEESETDKKLSAVGKRLFKESQQRPQRSQETQPARSAGNGKAEKRQASQSAGKSQGGQKAQSSRSNGNGGKRGSQSNGGGSKNSVTTTDPEEIRRWAEERGGQPACVKGTGDKGDIGMLRLEFPGKPNANDDKLQPISWEDFFEKFEERGLAMVFQEHTAEGEKSNFNKLVAREAEAKPKTRTARS